MMSSVTANGKTRVGASLFLLLLHSTATVLVSASCGESLSANVLDALSEAAAAGNDGGDPVSLFAPSVYYSDSKTKFVTAHKQSSKIEVLYEYFLCVDGGTTNSNGIQLYDDGTNGDDVANDGIYSRDCVHFCSSSVDFNDLYGFARMEMGPGGSNIVVLDVAKKGTVPYEEIDTPMLPGAKTYASSHAFFFSDVQRKYYPNFPWSWGPNNAAAPSGKSVAVAALLQVFGDVFDFVTVTNLEGRNNANNGAGIYKWQNWDRRGGPMLDQPVGEIDACASALSGVPAYRLNGVINAGDLVSGDGFSGLLHELIHGVSGFSYHYNLDAALTGDNMHVPGTCTVDNSPLRGPIWDWVTGYPDGIPRTDGKTPDRSVRLAANSDCNSCPDGQTRVEDCCSFTYENYPINKEEIMAKPDIFRMSPLLRYIAGMITKAEVPDDQKKYYCLGYPIDDYCGTHDGQHPCISKIDDKDPNNVTGDYATQFTFDDLVNANGGSRFPKKKFNVVRNGAVHVSLRIPSEAEITFFTLLWRHNEVADEPWELLNDKFNNVRFPAVPWKWMTDGQSILHSRLHGIDCGDDTSLRPPSCFPGSNAVCDSNSCGAGAICKNLDGQPLCICKEGLVGDGYECTYPSETNYGSVNSAHETSDKCFPEGNVWKNFISEDSIPPYPGGQEPYASTSCNGKGICPVGWRCNKNKGCIKPSSKKICAGRGLNKGQCLALGCCKFENSTCKEGDNFACAKSEDPFTPTATCADKNTCCYFSCRALEQFDGDQTGTLGQRGNCGTGCTDSVQPDINGVKHWEVYLDKRGYYAYNERHNYNDDDGPLKILGADKNMYNRCQHCFQEVSSDRFLVKIRKNGTLNTKTCNWLKTQKEAKKVKICKKRNISHQGYQHASSVCTDTCAPYVSAANTRRKSVRVNLD